MRMAGPCAALGIALLPVASAQLTAGSLGAQPNSLGCKPVAGLGKLAAAGSPAFILIGEPTETSEAPATFAEIACGLAARGAKLFVGVSDYFGGETDAEMKMRARLDELVAAGAPIQIGVISDQRFFNPRARDRSEELWAKALEADVAASGAKRALILLPRSDASQAAVPAGERNAAYEPMAMHLTGAKAISLEVVRSTSVATTEIRIFPVLRDGFSGALAFPNLTHPDLVLQLAPPRQLTPAGLLVHPSDARATSIIIAPATPSSSADRVEPDRLPQVSPLRPDLPVFESEGSPRREP